MQAKSVNYWNYIFVVLIGLGMFIFFTGVHSLVPYDEDDWGHLSVIRKSAFMLPWWGIWNPTRVLPESLYPLCGMIGAYIIRPINGDYLNSLTIAIAFTVSLFIASYIFLFDRFLQKRFRLHTYESIATSFIFFLAHFLILKSNNGINEYLFYSWDVTCYFFYLIPVLLNASLVLYFETIEGKIEDLETYKKSWVYFLVYLSICSNILSNIVLSSWIIGRLISDYSSRQGDLKNYIKENRLWIRIMLFYGVVLFFEANGIRATNIGRENVLTVQIFNVIGTWKQLILSNWKSLLVFGMVNILFLIGAHFSCKNIDNTFKNNYFSILKRASIGLIIWSAYILLISAKSVPAYAARPDICFGFFFYLFLIMMSAFSVILKTYPRCYYIVPLIIYCMWFRVIYAEQSFKMSAMSALPPEVCRAVSRDFIKQLVDNDYARKQTMKLYVPIGKYKNNWPHPSCMGRYIARTLYLHGIITYIPKEIDIVPSKEMNEKYHIPLPKKMKT